MDIMKQIILILIFLLVLVSSSYAQTFDYKNYTFSVTPIVESTCGQLQNKVLRIERDPYNSSMQAIEIKYNISCNNPTQEISKTFKQYTEAKTGSCTFLHSDNYTLSFMLQDTTVNWTIPVVCEEEEIIEEEIDKSPQCIETATLKTNHHLFLNEEQLTIEFFVSPTPDNLSIEYWIEDLEGNNIKKRRITTNTDLKKHTFKGIEGERIFLVKAEVTDDCNKYPLEQIVAVQGEKISVEKEETREANTTVAIQSVKQIDDQQLFVTAKLTRGDSRKSVVELYAIDSKGRKISRVEKIKLLSKESDITVESVLYIENFEEDITIVLEGLDVVVKKNILLERQVPVDILRLYTRQQSYEDNITWYVRLAAQGYVAIEIDTTNSTHFLYREVLGEETLAVSLPYYGGPITTTVRVKDFFVKNETTPTLKQLQRKQQNSPPLGKGSLANISQNSTKEILPQANISLLVEDEQTRSISPLFIYSAIGLVASGAGYALFKEQ